MNGQFVLEQQLGHVIRGIVPPWMVPLFLLVTRLGNVAVFLILFALDYWFVDHERGAHAISLVVGGMAFIVALKYFFDVPRPPAEVNAIPIDGYSFPSGHAAGATIAYGALAVDLGLGSRRARIAGASVLVSLIALSRVVLGVHFVEDVVAGVVFGVGFLAVAFTLTERRPRLGFLLAIAVSLAAFVISAGSRDGVAVLGAALGAAAAWEYLGEVPSVDRRRAKFLLVGVVLPALAGIGYVSVRWTLPPVVVFVLNAVLLAALLVAPVVEIPFERTGNVPRPQRQ